MKHRALTGSIASGVGLLLLGFACVDADIPNISNDLRDALEESYANGGASTGVAGSASTPMAGAAGDDGNGGAAGSGGEPDPGNGGAAGSGMEAMAGAAGDDGMGAAGSGAVGSGCDGFAILEANCGTAGCHGENGTSLDFAASEDAAREYIGEEGVICGGQGPIIDPDDPGASVLILKLSDNPPCAQPMPLGGAPLAEEDIACIEEWIGGL